MGKRVLSEEEQKAAMDKAYKEFMLARAEAINSFARLENYMSMLFCYLISGNNEPNAIVKGTEMFSEIVNTRARLRMIESLFDIRYSGNHAIFFKDLIEKIEKTANERNKIVHWILVTTQTGGEPANPSRDIYLAEHPDMFKKGKLYINDVNYFIRKAEFLGLLTFYFSSFIEHQHPSIQRGNPEKTSWSQIFQEKVVYPPAENHQIFQSYNSWKPMGL